MIERFTAHAPGLSPSARRTLRTNLRFIARAVVPHLYPADAPLPSERAKTPYTAARDRRVPGAGRRPARAGAAVARGGPGLPRRRCRLIRSDLRHVRGTDVTARSGGVVVVVRCARPRAVPVLARYHAPLL